MTEIHYRSDLWQLLEGIPGNAAEIGVAEGRFSAEMLQWPVNFPIVFLVDSWAKRPGQAGDGGYPQEWHESNMAQAFGKVEPFGQRAVVLRGDSTEMANQVPDASLALVYIDCDHSYEGVSADLLAWSPKVKAGGYVALHDYQNPDYGVKQAVQEFCGARGLEIHDIPEDKMEDAGAYFQWPGGQP